ncbi:hypothetical protein OP853_002661 [Salmonella enterica]|nr:hypothetical protein [Salmonella enterica]EKJ5694321.1 hypothetical protein [Salmonella enterica]
MQFHDMATFISSVDFEHLTLAVSGVDLDVLKNIVHNAQEGMQVNSPAWSSWS